MAALVVEDEQIFNFGRAAIWPQTAAAATKKSQNSRSADIHHAV